MALPSEGLTPVVLAAVEDLGVAENEFYGPKRQVRLSWVLNELDPGGNYFVIRRSYTLSLHEKARLYADLREILGSAPLETDNILEFLESLIGTSNVAVIRHGRRKGEICADIKMFLPARDVDRLAVPVSPAVKMARVA